MREYKTEDCLDSSGFNSEEASLSNLMERSHLNLAELKRPKSWYFKVFLRHLRLAG